MQPFFFFFTQVQVLAKMCLSLKFVTRLKQGLNAFLQGFKQTSLLFQQEPINVCLGGISVD